MKTKRDLMGQEKADALEDFSNDLWINLLNHGDYAEIGKVVVKQLMVAKSGSKYLSRKIIVGGS
jgi:hypothetical protein